MNLLAEVPTEVTPAMMGLAVIILLQLSQFFFAWRKDMRSSESVKKEDLATLRRELMDNINKVSGEVNELSSTMAGKAESVRQESARSRSEIHNRITDNALKTAALVEGQETVKQSLISLASKVDAIRQAQPHARRTP